MVVKNVLYDNLDEEIDKYADSDVEYYEQISIKSLSNDDDFILVLAPA